MQHLLYWSVQVLGPIWRFFRNRGFSALLMRAVRIQGDLGRRGERVARRYLSRQGWRIIAARSRELFGELDLVAVDLRRRLGSVHLFLNKCIYINLKY